jgi:gas vesicle protein
MANQNSAVDVARDALLVLGGALIGAAVALLYAPQSGDRTRKQIARKVEDVKDHAADLGEDIIEKVEDLKKSVVHQIDSGRDFVGEKKDVLLSNITSLEEKLVGIRKKIAKR